VFCPTRGQFRIQQGHRGLENRPAELVSTDGTPNQ
jgi:hypothetical protein